MTDPCEEKLDLIMKQLERITAFIDGNGYPGARVMLARHEVVLHVVIWAGALLVMSSLGFAGWIVQQAFAKVFALRG